MNTKKLTIWAVSAVLLCTIGVQIGRSIGTSIAQEDIVRLELFWPSILDLSTRDRAFLASLSLACRLHERPIERAEVLACLRSAAADPATNLPADEVQADAVDHLGRLLAISSEQ